METTALNGLKEICAYAQKSQKTLLLYIEFEGFPAKKVGGSWLSDKILIDNWRQTMLIKDNSKKL